MTHNFSNGLSLLSAITGIIVEVGPEFVSSEERLVPFSTQPRLLTFHHLINLPVLKGHGNRLTGFGALEGWPSLLTHYGLARGDQFFEEEKLDADWEASSMVLNFCRYDSLILLQIKDEGLRLGSFFGVRATNFHDLFASLAQYC